MAERKNGKSKSSSPRKPSRLRAWLKKRPDGESTPGVGRAVLWAVLVALFGIGGVVGMRELRDQVLRDRYRGRRGSAWVGLTHVPKWMPKSLARQIAGELTPPKATLADPDLARKVYERAQANPWVRAIRRVEVRPNPGRPGGIVHTHLTYRRPLARVREGEKYLYVDAEGFRLPETQVPLWVVTLQDRGGKVARQVSYTARGDVPEAWRAGARRIHYVVIDGVRTSAPPPGWKWSADDLQAGLRLVELVRARPYYPQITLVDVRNHDGRITRNQPELRMYAQVGRGPATDIRFGRFPAPGGGDYIISPRRKLSYLDEYAAENGGLVAGRNSYLDLRFDELHVSVN